MIRNLFRTSGKMERQARVVGMRMHCGPCEVGWTGRIESPCWRCDQPGEPGTLPLTYPETDQLASA